MAELMTEYMNIILKEKPERLDICPADKREREASKTKELSNSMAGLEIGGNYEI